MEITNAAQDFQVPKILSLVI